VEGAAGAASAGALLVSPEAVAYITLGSGVSNCDGTTHVQHGHTSANKWDETVHSAANRDTSPTAQVPKRFGPIYATASTNLSSGENAKADEAPLLL
jgi:hypothetical protein